MKRVAAIGLDAAEWWVIEKLMATGDMPNLAALRQRSTWCRLDNQVAYRSELPWTHFLTGRTPRQNGYWSTATFDPTTYRPELVGAYTGRPFYEVAGANVIALDVPHSTIREDVRGVQVTAWGAHSAQYPRASRPAGLLREIDARFGVHPALDNDYDGGWHQPKFLEALGAALVDGSRRRIDIAEWLMAREPEWDLFLTVMSESHSVGHHCWHGIDPAHPLHESFTADQARRWLTKVYQALDEGVGRIAASIDDDTALVVFAVHGMQVNENDVPSLALLPELAHRLQFGSALLADPDQDAWRRNGFPPLRTPERLNWRQHVGQRFAATDEQRRRRDRRLAAPDFLIEAARNLQRRLTGRPKMTWDFNTDFPPECDESIEAMGARRAGLKWQFPVFYSHRWPDMEWFVLPTFSDAHVRINLQGRERDGKVPYDDFLAACDRFEETVRKCVNPRTDNPAVADVIRTRDEPHDPAGADGDLVVIWSEPCDALEHPDVGIVGPLPFQRTGEHSPNGFLFVAGPGIEPGEQPTRAAADVTPTIMSLLGWDTDPKVGGTPFVAGALTPP